MKNLILYIGCFLCLFITTTTAPYLGIKTVGIFSYGILIILFFYSLFFNFRFFKKRNFKIEWYIIIVFLLYGLIKLVDDDIQSLQSSFFFLAVPMMISMLVQIQSVQTKQKIAKIVLFFFVIESILAIYERITYTNTFELDIIDDITSIDFESWSFRSTSFLGHPLNNALCVSIMMGTILVSKINEKYKFIFLIIGFLGILSFNARGATLVMSFIIIYYFYLSYKKYGRQIYYKTLLVLASIIGVSFFYYIITSTSLGGRLMNYDKIIDGSAQARLDVFEAFNYFSGNDFLFGNQSLYVPIMEKLAQGGIENSYIVIILKFGIIIGVPVIILLISYVFNKLKGFILSKKIILVFSFLIIGSTNNGLADITPWVIFILSINTLPYINYGFKENIGLNKIALKNYKKLPS